MDDALKSFSAEAEAVDVLQRAQKMLALFSLRLHKIASNRVEEMNAFSYPPPPFHKPRVLSFACSQMLQSEL